MDPVGTYTLPRGGAETARLNAQHRVYTTSVGFLLHPRIMTCLEDQSDVRIADVGTGTGVWHLNVAQQFDRAGWHFTGLDQSDAQFPRPTTSRIDFAVMDILKPPPEDMIGAFDVVHLRLLVCGLATHQWEIAAANVLSMLKPGGWIQWVELSPPTLTVYPSVLGAGSAKEKMIRIGVKDQQSRGKFHEKDGQLLKSRIEAAGFQQCEDFRAPSDRDPSTRTDGTYSILGAMTGFLGYSARTDGVLNLSEEQIMRILSEAKEEIVRQKVYLQWDNWVVSGRKASL